MLENLIHKKPDEHVVFQLRRHPVIFIVDVLLILVLAVVPLGLYPVIVGTLPNLATSQFFLPTAVLIGSSYYLLLWLFFFVNFVDFYLDLWIVTNDRVLNIEQRGLFSRTVSELDLSQVQDVTSEQHGIFAWVFGYGKVYIQTAAERERFIFEQVPNPEEIRKNMLALVEADRRRQAQEKDPV